jgi:hypothetical protein
MLRCGSHNPHRSIVQSFLAGCGGDLHHAVDQDERSGNSRPSEVFVSSTFRVAGLLPY